MQQQGDKSNEAFGAPGIKPRWTHGNKNGVGTAYDSAARLAQCLSGSEIAQLEEGVERRNTAS